MDGPPEDLIKQRKRFRAAAALWHRVLAKTQVAALDRKNPQEAPKGELGASGRPEEIGG